MPRRRRPRREYEPPRTERIATEIGAPKGWIAQRYNGREPGPDYTCPRCHQPVKRMTEHVVAWTTDEDGQHRHWHAACWTSAVREGIDRYRWG